jgi:hypothetical protein
MEKDQMSSHTSGPWKVDGFTKRGTYARISGNDWAYFAKVIVRFCDEPSPIGQANARLIAAAPDLLEALEKILVSDREGYPNCNLFSDDLARAKAAIAKAKGEA